MYEILVRSVMDGVPGNGDYTMLGEYRFVPSVGYLHLPATIGF